MPKRKRILDYLKDFIEEHDHHPPTLEEIGGRAPDHTGRTFPYRAADAAGSESARNAGAARR